MATRTPRHQERKPTTPLSTGKLVVALVVFLVVVAGLWGFVALRGLGPQLGLDLRGGVSLTLIPVEGQPEVDEEILEQTVDVIRRRVDALGVAEPDVARQGETVLVQLPGVADVDEAIEVVGRTAVLQFRRVLDIALPGDPDYQDVAPPCDELTAEVQRAGPPPEDEDLVLCASAEAEEGETIPPEQRAKFHLGPVEVAGERIDNARAELDPAGIAWQVALDFDSEGDDQFAGLTGELACEPIGVPQRQLAIVLDGVVESAPEVSERVACGTGIRGGGVIEVGPDQEAARTLALVLRTGALPIQLEFATAQSVSPTLGEASLVAGLQAGALGLLLVAGYLILLYRGIGAAAVLELLMFGVLLSGVLIVLGELIGFTLTLAGVAGIIVAIGITADSSIIYRERYRDEIAAGRTVRTAAEVAFRKAFRTNLTGNTVSFIAAVVLWILAVGPVRGFAFTLGLATLIDTLLFATFTRSVFGLIARNPKLASSRWVGLRADVVSPALAGERSDAQDEREPSTAPERHA